MEWAVVGGDGRVGCTTEAGTNGLGRPQLPSPYPFPFPFDPLTPPFRPFLLPNIPHLQQYDVDDKILLIMTTMIPAAMMMNAMANLTDYLAGNVPEIKQD